MNVCKWIGLLAFSVVLVGCGKSAINTPPETNIDEASVVLSVTETSLFADETSWTVTEKTKFRTHSGAKLKFSDVKTGDLIVYTSDGPIMESYPMQGRLDEVVLLDDELSLKVSASISSFLDHQPEGDLLIFTFVSIDEDKVTAEMKRRDLEDDRLFSVEIDLETNEFKMTEKSGAQD